MLCKGTRRSSFTCVSEEARRSYPAMFEEEARNSNTSAQRLQALSTDPCLRIIIAGNPATPAGLLEHLAQDQDEGVRQAVTGNANTPWQTLEHLAEAFPHEFLSNPVLPLHLLAHP